VFPGVQLLTTPAGDLYIHAEAATVVPDDVALYILKGTFRTGQKAVTLMREGGNWVEWNMTASSIVAITSTMPTISPLPTGCQPLEKILAALEVAGYVRCKLHKHSIANEGGKWDIKSLDTIALEPDSREKGTPTLATISAYVDLEAVKASKYLRVVHRLDFNPKDKSINAGYPAVYLDKPLRLGVNEVACLAKAKSA
jgi:hypothetical protein